MLRVVPHGSSSSVPHTLIFSCGLGPWTWCATVSLLDEILRASWKSVPVVQHGDLIQLGKPSPWENGRQEAPEWHLPQRTVVRFPNFVLFWGYLFFFDEKSTFLMASWRFLRQFYFSQNSNFRSKNSFNRFFFFLTSPTNDLHSWNGVSTYPLLWYHSS